MLLLQHLQNIIHNASQCRKYMYIHSASLQTLYRLFRWVIFRGYLVSQMSFWLRKMLSETPPCMPLLLLHLLWSHCKTHLQAVRAKKVRAIGGRPLFHVQYFLLCYNCIVCAARYTPAALWVIRIQYFSVLQWGLSSLSVLISKTLRAKTISHLMCKCTCVQLLCMSCSDCRFWPGKTTPHGDHSAQLASKTAYDEYSIWYAHTK